MSLCPVPKCQKRREPDDILCDWHWRMLNKQDRKHLEKLEKEYGVLSDEYRMFRGELIKVAVVLDTARNDIPDLML